MDEELEQIEVCSSLLQEIQQKRIHSSTSSFQVKKY